MDKDRGIQFIERKRGRQRKKKEVGEWEDEDRGKQIKIYDLEYMPSVKMPMIALETKPYD